MEGKTGAIAKNFDSSAPPSSDSSSEEKDSSNDDSPIKLDKSANDSDVNLLREKEL